MSKIMNDLKQLSQRRKLQGDILIEEEQPTQETARIVQGPGGKVLVLGGLLVLLIVLSVISMVTSVKIYQQMEKTGIVSNTLIQNLRIQGDEIRELKALVQRDSEEGLIQTAALNDQLDGLRKKQGEMSKASESLKKSVESSLEDLKASSELMQNKYILLNDKVKKLEDNYSIFYNVN